MRILILLILTLSCSSSTFQSVQEKNDKIWMLQRYDLVFEYKESSLLPPPLNLIGYLIEWAIKMYFNENIKSTNDC